MIKIKNVMFDENFSYDKNKIDLMQLINELMLKTAFEIFDFISISRIEKLESDFDKKFIINQSIDQSINTSTQSKNKQIDQISFNQNFFSSSSSTFDSENSENFNFFLISDKNSKFFDAFEATASEISSSSKKLSRFVSIDSTFRNIFFKIDESNIVSEKMKRIKIKKQTYFAVFDRIESDDDETFHDAFSAHITADDYYKKNSLLQFNFIIKIHKNYLSLEFQHYDELRKHLHADEFKQIMRVELKVLKSKNTWFEISINKNITSIFIIWTYIYKFDDQNYLIKYKTRLCVRKDLQKTNVDTYAVTLIVRIFRTLMIIINAFDLKTRQYDAVNVFVNNEIDESIYFRSSIDWNENQILFFLHRVFYDFKQFSVLWYRHFSKILIEFDFNQISEVECLFINDHMLCFFFREWYSSSIWPSTYQ